MKPLDVYQKAVAFGLRLEPSGDRLLVFGDRCPPDFADLLREHKTELLDWLCRASRPGWQSVPPDNLPMNHAMPQPPAEDRDRVIAYSLRQGCTHPNALTAWLMRRECLYYEGPGDRWDCVLHAYAASRDAACWQLNCSERDLWQLLSAFEECGGKAMKP